MGSSSPSPSPSSSPPRDAWAIEESGPLLVVRLDSGRFALPLSKVSELMECGPIWSVPHAPPGVFGLAERRGRLLTVLDLARLLGGEPGTERHCLVRLAAPLDHLALAVPSAADCVSLRAAPGSETVTDDQDRDGPITVIDPASLLAALEAAVSRASRVR